LAAKSGEELESQSFSDVEAHSLICDGVHHLELYVYADSLSEDAELVLAFYAGQYLGS